MSLKGKKLTKDSVINTELLLDELMSIDGITSKRMFGGHGIFHEDKMFGLVNSKGVCYFKVNEKNRQEYEDNGGEKHPKLHYYRVPMNILEDRTELMKWALNSIEISK